jgi:DNA-binding ferritin-like protein
MSESIGKIIGVLFMSRTYSHMAHLKTGSYSKHKALNKFYDEIVDLADALAEATQGKYGKLNIPFVDMKGDIDDPIAGITTQLTMLENLCKKCDDEYISNIFQEIQALYRSTLYKMKELS